MSDTTPSWLDVIVVLGLLFLMGSALYILAFVNIPDKNSSLFSALVGGVIGAGLMAYINNRWGSSRGSLAKDATIATLATTASTQPQVQPPPKPLVEAEPDPFVIKE